MTDLEMYRGNDRTFSLTITRDNGEAVDLGGASLRFLAKLGVMEDDADAVITKDNGSTGGITITDAPHGQVDIMIDSADTVDLYAPLVLIYAVELTEQSGYISTAAQGTLLIRRTIIPA